MKKVLSLVLAGVVGMVSLLSTAKSTHAQTMEDLTAQFQAELANYAQTHTDAEVSEYANWRISQMTDSAEEPPAYNSLAAYDMKQLINPDLRGDETYEDCYAREWEICRRGYNAALFTSAGIGFGLGGACTLATAGAGLVLCLGGALATHGFGIAAARENRRACELRGDVDCRRGAR